MKTKQINLEQMPEGERYEDAYGSYLRVFEEVGTAASDGIKVMVHKPPASWVPLLRYLGAEVKEWQMYFSCDPIVAAVLNRGFDLDRTTIEVLCGFRPELVDALWKADFEWVEVEVPNEKKKEFIVTNNGSFWRPEVLHYWLETLPKYRPKKKKVVLVPCAADKPYPAPMHKAVLERMPDDFYLCIATGVLGLVPQELWPSMPHYDSGIPNEWRVQNTVAQYFTAFKHERIVVYGDFYNMAICNGLMLAECAEDKVSFVNEIRFYSSYLDLLDPARLAELEQAFAK